jgi:hypothetical protein
MVIINILIPHFIYKIKKIHLACKKSNVFVFLTNISSFLLASKKTVVIDKDQFV